MSTQMIPKPDRQARRRTRTRDALISAAQHLLAVEGVGFSVQAVADNADLALTTLYNHFDSKDALVAAAFQAALADFGEYLRERTTSLRDDFPARLAASMRLYGRMPETHPDTARILVATAGELPGREQGINPSSQWWLEEYPGLAAPSGSDQWLKMFASSAALDRLLAVRLSDANVDTNTVDQLVGLLLRWWNLTEKRAKALATQPLPPWPNP